jgi:hypothetical protein
MTREASIRIRASVLPADRTALAELDRQLIDGQGNLRVMPADTLRAYQLELLQAWAVSRGVYVFPTAELILWLRTAIGTDLAIEIGAGHGAIARALGIPATDSYMQLIPEVRAYYESLGQQVVTPPADVIKLEALAAVRHYRPHTVIGAFITQKWLSEADTEASAYGVHEEQLLKLVRRYIMIGNDNVHGKKRLLRCQHAEVRQPWIVTRARDHHKNVIYIWEP